VLRPLRLPKDSSQTTAGRLGEARRHVREATARERRCVGDRRSGRRYHPGLRWDR